MTFPAFYTFLSINLFLKNAVFVFEEPNLKH